MRSKSCGERLLVVMMTGGLYSRTIHSGIKGNGYGRNQRYFGVDG